MEQKIAIKENISISENGFIFDASSGDTFSCNTVGTEILKLIQAKKSLDAMKEYITNTYNTDVFTFEKDFFDFISNLKQQHLITIEEV